MNSEKSQARNVAGKAFKGVAVLLALIGAPLIGSDALDRGALTAGAIIGLAVVVLLFAVGEKLDSR